MKNKSYESWITQFVERLADFFNFQGWRISITYTSKEGGDNYAEISVNSVYQFAELTVYPQTRRDFESGNLERLVMGLTHELVHIFLDPFHDAMHDHLSAVTTPAFLATLETQTQRLTAVFLKTLPECIIPPLPPRRKK